MIKFYHSFVNEKILTYLFCISLLVVELYHFISITTVLVTIIIIIILITINYSLSQIIVTLSIIAIILINCLFASTNNINDHYRVSNVTDYTLTITNKHQNILVYSKNTSQFQKNDIITITESLQKIKNNDFSTTFNPKRYYNSKSIYYATEQENIDIIKKTNTRINNRLLFTFVRSDLLPYYNWFLFGENHQDIKEIKTLLTQLSLIHIFVISGFHITLLANILKKIFKNNLLVYCVLIIVLIALNFSASACRAILYYILLNILKAKKLSNKGILMLVGSVLILVYPFMSLSIGFRLSIGMTYAILTISQYVKNKIGAFFILQLVILPVVIFMQYEISPIFFLLSLIITPYYLFTMLFLLANLIIPIDFIVKFMLDVLIIFLDKVSNTIPFLLFGKPTIIWMLLYYFILYTIVRKSNYKGLIVIITLLLGKYMFSPLYSFVTYIDVGQGDAILIKPALTNEAILIDTGGSIYSDITNDRIIPYLKRENIKKLKAVLISHDDFDHSGGLEVLEKKYPISNIINPIKTSYSFKNGQLLRLNTQPIVSDDSNDQCSIFLYSSLNSTFLFTGDATRAVEQSLYTNESLFSIDYLKVAHHGSNTSTSDLFLKQVSPRYAIISVGKNFYGHPHYEVIARLQKHNINILTTQKQGTIKVVIMPFYDVIFTNNPIIFRKK